MTALCQQHGVNLPAIPFPSNERDGHVMVGYILSGMNVHNVSNFP